MFSVGTLGLITEMVKKVQIKASLFPLWPSSFWPLPEWAPSLRRFPRLWPAEKGRIKTFLRSPVLSLPLHWRHKPGNAPVEGQKSTAMRQGSISAQLCASSVVNISSVAPVSSAFLRSLMWGRLHARSLSAFRGRTEQWKKKKPFHDGS